MTRLTRFGAPLVLALLCFQPASRARDFSFAAFGDYPRNATQDVYFLRAYEDLARYPQVEFILHVGDFKSGGAPCDVEFFDNRVDLFGKSPIPLVLLPGDNEFNDCDDWEVAIEMWRERFAAGSQALGKPGFDLVRQTDAEGGPPFPEHVRWEVDGIHFCGVNMVGSSNNRSVTDEWRARTDAGAIWLERFFDRAIAEEAEAAVVSWHVNPFVEDKTPYEDLLEVLKRRTIEYGKPVLLIHGDSHYFRLDKPVNGEDRRDLPNLSRLETFGSPNPHWVEVRVERGTDWVFTAVPHILPD